jgi:hypothetical protein
VKRTGGDAAAIRPDADNPWLGLASYTEETRAYFHGREDEAGELARRVQRRLLTVLFGQSGLGKTSLLRAGLVPRLRGEGFCPVYVRVDYSADAPSPAEQIKQAIFRATAETGHWTQAGAAVEGESLWEFLHHRGDLLRDAQGRTVLPLLIFDQFEEVFTLAQVDDAGRSRARQFLAELSDLVENRPPRALEIRIDRDEVDAGDFDFARADYRVLIALREDYLAHLESLKVEMPSVTQNRMRLARMSGAQALAAVRGPGGGLVSAEVAESIVRFVAGGAVAASAEVEPSLLSLVCRELNLVRQQQGRTEISADLLAGSRDTILSEFYERSLADQPPGVRRVIEDELLTESGYRESLAEERVAKALSAAGAGAEALATLVDRRLLRIEERLDVRRVELTHDVLCPVVKSSRDLRHEREALEEAERALAAQRERAAETRRTLQRTRRFAFVAAGLLLLALLSAVFGWVSWNRARAADAQAQQARADAERLVAFLIEDFYEELQPTGRLETLGKLAHMAVQYYDGLPPELQTAQTRQFRGMALIREAHALLAKGDVAAGNARLDEARAIFEDARKAGDDGQTAALGLALAKFTRFSAWGVNGAPGSTSRDLVDARELLRPYVARPDASRQVRLVYADVLNYLSHHRDDKTQGVADCEEARGVLRALGATELRDLTAASIYADTADSQARHSAALGLTEEAEALEREVHAIADGVLAQRPGDLRSMTNRALALGFLTGAALWRHDFDRAEELALDALEAAKAPVSFNPSSMSHWDLWIRAGLTQARIQRGKGRVTEAIATLRGVVDLRNDPRLPSSLLPQLVEPLYELAILEGASGDLAAARRSRELTAQSEAENRALLENAGGTAAVGELGSISVALLDAQLAHLGGDAGTTLARATELAGRVQGVSVPADDTVAENFRDDLTRWILLLTIESAIDADRPEEAVAAAQELLRRPSTRGSATDRRETQARTQVQLATALAMLGRGPEAADALRAPLELYEGLAKSGARDFDFRIDHASALLADAMWRPAGDPVRVTRLREARRQLETLSAESKQLFWTRQLLRRVEAADG